VVYRFTIYLPILSVLISFQTLGIFNRFKCIPLRYLVLFISMMNSKIKTIILFTIIFSVSIDELSERLSRLKLQPVADYTDIATWVMWLLRTRLESPSQTSLPVETTTKSVTNQHPVWRYLSTYFFLHRKRTQ